ncbi:virion structural protein [Pseudomonas phage Noxifer]|uniref:Virion structural protein n=1 Tax=Pseudomonas phage Noxifer TaxID=2006684 RepID=A0A1Y0SV08_9CAUD|nr:virion structural protein [Pseudomonas phage Noxifer]ARV77341.1 virion structural protein [Pseudomonas phage Noxifer]
MYTLKGFFTFAGLFNNQLDQVAPFGELSEDAKSYAKDKLTYTNGQVSAETSLVVFHTVKDNVRIPAPVTVSNTALTIGAFLISRARSGQIPVDAYILRQQLNAEFASLATDFQTGAILTGDSLRMPEWISYKDSSAGLGDNTVTVWLSDTSFSNQYDEFDIEVVPPILPLDDFFKDPLVVKGLIADYDLVEKTDEAQAKKGKYPFTQIKTLRYDYNNPVVPTDLTPTYWIVLIYGQAGNNPDLIREAIVKEVLDKSTHTRDEWAVILPDLFRTTEFIFTPFWNQYSVPNHEFQGGIYSPTVNPREVLPVIKRTARGTGYTDVYVEGRYEISQNIYKSLAFGVVGNPDNRDGLTQFSDKFPDYMVVSNDNDDADRMSATTVEWSALFSRLLVAAEEMTMYTAVPQGLSRVQRDGIVYASGYYKNVNYLVASKPSLASL